MKIHLGLTLLSLTAGVGLGIEPYEWLAIFLATGMVFCAEMFNTVMEQLTNVLLPEQSVSARRIKDLSAGAVLIASIFALGVALLIFPARILEWMGI